MLNIRLAGAADREVALRLAAALLAELGGTPPPEAAMSPVFDRLVGGGGFVVIGERDGVAIAVCTASFVDSSAPPGGMPCFRKCMWRRPSAVPARGWRCCGSLWRRPRPPAASASSWGRPGTAPGPSPFTAAPGFAEVGARMRWLPDSGG